MKEKFFGKYYKFVSRNGYSFAIIDYFTNDTKGIQVITPNKSYELNDISKVNIKDNEITFNVNENDISIIGNITILNKKTPKKDVMGIFRHLPIECKHNLYIPFGNIKGNLIINSKKISFDDGFIYVEGDEGKSFPKKYIWINGIDENTSFTVSLATIPLGLFKILGHFAYLYTNEKEYRFATYNFSKIKEISDKKIIIKKGKYTLEVNFVPTECSHDLKAPSLGKMSRTIREAVLTTSNISLYKYKKLIYQKDYPYTSLERVDL